jgi:predicted dinucleotide-binding enzyme
LGAGNVGGALGRALARCGHEIVFGVRDTGGDKVTALLQSIERDSGHASASGIAEAVHAAEIVALTVPWPAANDVLLGISDWSGKIVIDATNRIGQPDGGTSAAEEVERLARGAKVVKAFNTIGAEHLENPAFGGERASMFICGDDDGAKRVVGGLAEELGFEVVDAGPLAQARLLESLRLWVSLAQAVRAADCIKLLRQ